MLAPWTVEEMNDADLKDKRLNERLTQVLSQLSGHLGLGTVTRNVTQGCALVVLHKYLWRF